MPLKDKRCQDISNILWSQRIIDGKVSWVADEDPIRILEKIREYIHTNYSQLEWENKRSSWTNDVDRQGGSFSDQEILDRTIWR